MNDYSPPTRHLAVVAALHNLRPNSKWSMTGAIITWKDEDQTQPTDEEIQTEIDRAATAYEQNQYARNRSSAYPTLEDQQDMQYWDSVNGTTTWADAIAAVKAANPKP